MKTFIERKERNLLINSDYIYNSTELNWLSVILEQKITITKKNVDITADYFTLINTNKHLWIEYSQKEWKLNTDIPHIKNPSLDRSTWNRCDLCNTAHKEQFSIINKYNGNVLAIGGTCVHKFMGKEIGFTSKNVLKNAKSAHKYEALIKDYPLITDLLFKDSDFLKETKIIMPSIYTESFTKLYKNTKNFITDYLENDYPLDNDKLKALLKKYENEKDVFSKFYIDKSLDSGYLPRDIADLIYREQPEIYTFITDYISNNKGIISNSIAGKIKNIPFLNWFKSFFHSYDNDFSIGNVAIGKIFLAYDKFNTTFSFVVSSDKFITYYMKNKNYKIRSMDDFTGELKNYYKEFPETLKSNTKYTSEKLIDLSFNNIIDNSSLKFYNIEYEYVFGKVAERDKNYVRNSDLLEEVTAPYIYFHQKDKIYVFQRKELTKFGMKILFLDNTETNELIELLIKQSSNVFSISLFYKNIKNDIELKKNF